MKPGLHSVFNMLWVAAILLLFPSCKPENMKEGAVKEYFDIEGYFEKNVKQLQKLNPKIAKTVVHNGQFETKVVEIDNWKTELSLFTESDINKPSWKGSYALEDSAGSIVYTAKYPELRTRRIVINKDNEGVIKGIAIYNEVNNALYTTRETLSYLPGSAYNIEKYQKIKLLGANTYKITGKFN